MNPDLNLILTVSVLAASFWPVSELLRMHRRLHYADQPLTRFWALLLASPGIIAAALCLLNLWAAFGSYLTGDNLTRPLMNWPAPLGLALLLIAVPLAILADVRELILRPLKRR